MHVSNNLPETRHRRNADIHTVLFGTSSGNVEKPQNEFSRTFNTESLLYKRRVDYETFVEADEEELKKLAKRFKLSNIASLRADIGMKMDGECVVVRGKIFSTVTQCCVRTNLKFEDDVEFDFFTVMRPVSDQKQNDEIEAIRYKDKRSRKKSEYRATRQLDELGMKELQEVMQDFDLEDDTIEDASVFDDGTLDAGELVAQIFRIKLDPYPKKPGTDPVVMEFSL